MRILLLTEHLGSCDGSSTHVHNLASMLTHMGHTVTIVAGDIDGDYEGPESVLVVEMRELSHRRRSMLRFARGHLHLAVRWKRLRPDVVHAHHYYAAMMVLPICTVHGIPLLQSQHAFLERRGVLPPCPARRIVAMSAAIHDSIVDVLMVQASKVFTVPYGTSVDVALNLMATNETGPVRLLFAGRLTEQKGPQVLLDALSLIGDGLEYQCIIAGDGPLHNAIRESAFSTLPHVEVLGSCLDMAPLYAWADICIFPFTSSEPFGLVTIEAGSYGKAVIVTDVPYQNTIITHEENGLLVPPGDAPALAQAIQTLGSDGVARARLGNALRGTVSSKYSLEVMTRYIVQHYQALRELS